jgi:hypothetical protein
VNRLFVLIVAFLIALPLSTYAQTTIRGTDGSFNRTIKTNSDGILLMKDEFPSSSSAPVIFDMANAATLAGGTLTITDLGAPYSAASDFYSDAFIISTSATSATHPIQAFIKTSTDGTNYDFVIFMRDSTIAAGGSVMVVDTLSWYVMCPTPSTGLGRGVWCSIPPEAQNAYNSAQHVKLAFRNPNANTATISSRFVGKR